MTTRTKYDFFVNNLPDAFPTNNNCFKFLGLLTEHGSDLLRLRGKALSLKSRSKGTIDLCCRNPKEFESYISNGTFQGHHMASIMTQLFDPCFNLNSTFFCVAKLLNCEIISSYEGTMAWTRTVDLKLNRKLVKLVSFYFKIQSLNIPRYLLCKELSLGKMSNMILAFSDGSLQISTCAIYLLSYNTHDPEFSVDLVSTLCRLGEICTKKGENNTVNTVPK